MANNATDVLNVARGQIGYNRWDDPNPGTIYGRWYAQSHGSYYGQSGVPFCAMFDSWVFDQAGASCAGLPNAYCPYILNAAKAAGRIVNKTSAQPGDVVLFNWDGGVVDHVGIVEKNYGSYIQTIEGNTTINGVSGAVGRRTRNWSVVAAIVRPYYDGSAPTTSGSSGLDLGEDLTIWGPKFTKAMQSQRGTIVDGVISGQYSGNKKYFWDVEAGTVTYENDGVSALVRSLQQLIINHGFSVGASGVDGHMGHDTIQGHQHLLESWGFSVGASGCDGYNGPDTNRAVASALQAGKYK